MNPRAEAQAKAGDGYDARVLEPSPPAVNEGPWFADDPVARGDATRPVLSPVSSGDVTWASFAAEDAALGEWCRERWLGPYQALAAVPPGYAETRIALHAVAEHVLKPAREKANGKIGLRYVRGGFGTPFFGDDAQVSVRGTELVVVRGDAVEQTPLTTLAAAAEALGALAAEPPRPEGSRPPAARPPLPSPPAARRRRDSPPNRSRSTRPRRGSSATGSASPTPSSKSSAPARPARRRPRACRSGPSTSTPRSSSATRPPTPAPPTAARPATSTTPSPTSTSPPGPPARPATSGTPKASPAPSSPYADLLATADPRALALEFFAERARALG